MEHWSTSCKIWKTAVWSVTSVWPSQSSRPQSLNIISYWHCSSPTVPSSDRDMLPKGPIVAALTKWLQSDRFLHPRIPNRERNYNNWRAADKFTSAWLPGTRHEHFLYTLWSALVLVWRQTKPSGSWNDDHAHERLLLATWGNTDSSRLSRIRIDKSASLLIPQHHTILERIPLTRLSLYSTLLIIARPYHVKTRGLQCNSAQNSHNLGPQYEWHQFRLLSCCLDFCAYPSQGPIPWHSHSMNIHSTTYSVAAQFWRTLIGYKLPLRM